MDFTCGALHGPNPETPRACIAMISERLANRHRYPCAKRVTWTRRHPMTRDRKALILIALWRTVDGGPNRSKSVNEKARNTLTPRAFKLVAGVGFEPTTFRL